MIEFQALLYLVIYFWIFFVNDNLQQNYNETLITENNEKEKFKINVNETNVVDDRNVTSYRQKDGQNFNKQEIPINYTELFENRNYSLRISNLIVEIFKNHLDSFSCHSNKMRVEVESLTPNRLFKLLNTFKENIQIYFNKSKKNLSMDEKSAKKFKNDIYIAIENITCSVCKFEYNLFWHCEISDYYLGKQLFEIVKLIHIDFTTVSNILEKKSQTDQTVVNNAYQLILNHTKILEKLIIPTTFGQSNSFYLKMNMDHLDFYEKQKYYINYTPKITINNLKNYFDELLKSEGDGIVNCEERNYSHLYYKYDIFVYDWKEMRKINTRDFNDRLKVKRQNFEKTLKYSVNYPERMVHVNTTSLSGYSTEENKFFMKGIFCILKRIVNEINDIASQSKLIIYDHYVNVPSAIYKLKQFLFSLEASPFINYQKLTNIYFYSARQQILNICFQIHSFYVESWSKIFSCSSQRKIKRIKAEIRTCITELRNPFKTPNQFQLTETILKKLKKIKKLSGCIKTKNLNTSQYDIINELKNEIIAFNQTIDENDNLLFKDRNSNFANLICKNFVNEFNLLKFNLPSV
ncbi:uncharacterized protein LOC122499627 isoform X2 [Leptopilina heterotoma]|uniref:uncharacterized protein LOC122499627 isoform X2 n=1 Tax=Leptopilina heterotoma TaxID=63436 RepID=UPI001CA95721|nr:uncharacterized protein LOC122499627 isoform X2 [Leptopilina heterotoma]